jgi:nucleoside-diphosphate-sugar epimerase
MMKTKRVLITGGNGFIGKAIANGALSKGFTVRVSSRQKPVASKSLIEYFQVESLSPATDWSDVLQGVDVVVHCAGRAHVMKETAINPLFIYRTINQYGTLNLARQASDAGVTRFVFLSSIGVNGAQSVIGKPFSELDKPNPVNNYALSKWEAELDLLSNAAETCMEVVIIRPPLVYGPSAPGNFGSLMTWLKRGVPLPLGSVHNQRSFLALGNLVDFIVTCITHPKAANQTFLVSDGQDVSTTDLVRFMAKTAGVSARLLPVPVSVLQAGAWLLGKDHMLQRLCGNLQVDISKARSLLGWVPPITLDEGLRRAME